jgi:hypothetical protein
MFAPSSSI